MATTQKQAARPVAAPAAPVVPATQAAAHVSPPQAATQSSERRYAVLSESNVDYPETWFYFLHASESNLPHLKHLADQINMIDWEILEGCSVFAIDADNTVSEQCAIDMCKIDLHTRHVNRKFDGVMRRVDFGFHKKHRNHKLILKVNDLLLKGKISQYIDDEHVIREESTSSGGEIVSEEDDSSVSESTNSAVVSDDRSAESEDSRDGSRDGRDDVSARAMRRDLEAADRKKAERERAEEKARAARAAAKPTKEEAILAIKAAQARAQSSSHGLERGARADGGRSDRSERTERTERSSDRTEARGHEGRRK